MGERMMNCIFCERKQSSIGQGMDPFFSVENKDVCWECLKTCAKIFVDLN